MRRGERLARGALHETPREERPDRRRAARVESRAEVEPKSVLGKALGYMTRQWSRLTTFLRDPKMELTNNEVDRDLRRWV